MASNAHAPRKTTIEEFYDGLYHSPIYAQHHRTLCNVGFHPLTALPSSAEAQLLAQHPQDQFSLQLYQELFALVPEDLTRRLRAQGNREAVRVLDAGCGPGGGLCKLRTLFPHAELLGVDVSSQAMERTKENWKAFAEALPKFGGSSKPRLFQQSFESMSSVASASVDVVCSVQALSEATSVQQALSEFARVLVPGGWLFIADFVPSDASTDRIQQEVLDRTNPVTSDLELMQQKLVSFNAAISCKNNSPSMEKLIEQFIPSEFQADMQTFFFVKKSTLYEELRLGQRGYRLLALRKQGRSETDSPRENTKQDGEGESWSDANADHGSESDYSEGEIDDDDLPNFYEPTEMYPQLAILQENYDVILEEMNAVMQSAAWPCWPEKHYASAASEWRVFPFCYTFPAYDASRTTWVDATCAMCPRTVALLKSLPDIRTALFSKLGPKTTLGAHRGWADLSNDILRCHLGLVVPTLDNGKPCCSMVVGDDAQPHQDRGLMVFDDSKLHYAYNHHPTKTRIVLIVDFYRPDHLPRGRARGGHTDELDEFIETFGRQAMGGMAPN
ncbi:TPA: hypothetical protein N0F65_008736 [Lagenidium giganteum]|uniref:Aspartyl/asparaginy/proline hydroxylase domain-containing protein n=1 Tax=Lagenidium giganteum TaxID=4803 RepID=A0AAV2Z5E6_9STRA|nr:TPA: hypothetical protein N0F65_008736 [Lagenidium giganteum]